MNRNSRLVVVLLVAVLMATLASAGVYMAVRSMGVREVEVARTQAVVAARPLPVGTLITKDDVKVVPWPAASPVAGSFQSVDQVTNRGTIVSIAENELIIEPRLAPLGAGAGLQTTIPEGMRAISVKVNEVIGVAGFVIPGTRVDVLVTLKGGADDAQTRTVLSNIQVLTAGTRYDHERAQQEGKPIPTSVVTLLLTPEDAEKLTLATDEGRIMLSLRNPLDQNPTETKGIRRAALLGAPAPPPVQRVVQGRPIVKAAPPPPPPPAAYIVETIRAAKKSEEEIR